MQEEVLQLAGCDAGVVQARTRAQAPVEAGLGCLRDRAGQGALNVMFVYPWRMSRGRASLAFATTTMRLGARIRQRLLLLLPLWPVVSSAPALGGTTCVFGP